jgi:hypothetical protein
VGAVQLSHGKAGMTLSSLIADGSLSSPPSGDFALPGSADEQAVLGYLHANCGQCHRSDAQGAERSGGLQFWLTTGALGTVGDTDTYKTAVNQLVGSGTSTSSDYRIFGSEPGQSELIHRMDLRGVDQMPPLATEDIDTDAVTMISEWIEGLPPPAAGGAGGGGN